MWVEPWVFGTFLGIAIIATLTSVEFVHKFYKARKIAETMLTRVLQTSGTEHRAWIKWNDKVMQYDDDQMDDWYKLVAKLEV